jgi:ribonucleoside-diphosphate reductase alpha chain
MNEVNEINSVSDDNKTEERKVEHKTSYNQDIQGEMLYGEVCSHCGSDRLMRNGTCKVCLDCGTTTGCS